MSLKVRHECQSVENGLNRVCSAAWPGWCCKLGQEVLPKCVLIEPFASVRILFCFKFGFGMWEVGGVYPTYKGHLRNHHILGGFQNQSHMSLLLGSHGQEV